MPLETLFSSENIDNVPIKNRIIRSATFTRSATDDGHVTDDLIEYYTTLAKGGVGLIITGIVSIDEVGKAGRGQACLYDDSYIEGQKKLVKAVHDYSDVKIAPQLSHAGRQGRTPVAPSPIIYQVNKKMPKELTKEDIQGVIKSFIDVACRAYECEYDLVQLNAGHGWLLCNFLSPHTNKRTDEFGGNIENRTRILVNIYKGISDMLGRGFPVIVKLQTQDFVKGGLTLSEGKQIAKILVDTGYAAIEPSGGSGDTLLNPGKTYPSLVINAPEEQNYFLPIVNELKPIMGTSKLILMGGVRDPLKMDELLRDKKADFIAMSRPLICEPNLPNKWKNDSHYIPLCTNCNSCYMSVLSGPVKCTIKRKLLRQRQKEEK